MSMPKPARGLWHYIRAAFSARVPVKGLGGVPANWLALAAFGALGALNPGFLLLGLGAELAYLAGLSHNSRFRKVVDGQYLLREATAWQDRLREKAAGLSRENRERLATLMGRCARIAQLSESPLGAEDAIAQLREGSLNRLVWIYARLLQSREIITTQIDPLARKKVMLELEQKEAALARLTAPAQEATRKSLEGTLEILRRRLALLSGADEKVRHIDIELGRIEQQVELIIEEAALAKDGGDLSSRIDAVASTLDESNAWMAANRDLLGAVGEEEPPPVLLQGVEER